MDVLVQVPHLKIRYYSMQKGCFGVELKRESEEKKTSLHAYAPLTSERLW